MSELLAFMSVLFLIAMLFAAIIEHKGIDLRAAICHQKKSGTNPNLIKCPDCGRHISRVAASCPNCGRADQSWLGCRSRSRPERRSPADETK